MFDFFDLFDFFSFKFWFRLARFTLVCSVLALITGFVTDNHELIMYSGIILLVSLILVIVDAVFRFSD